MRYEEKAKKLAEEHAAKQEAADKAFNNSLAMYPPAQSPNAEASRMSPATNARPMTPGQHANQGNHPHITPDGWSTTLEADFALLVHLIFRNCLNCL